MEHKGQRKEGARGGLLSPHARPHTRVAQAKLPRRGRRGWVPARGGDGQPVEERAGVPRGRESREKEEERIGGGEREW